MKKNIYFLGILSFLLALVYLIEERGGQRREEEREKSTQVFHFLFEENEFLNKDNLLEIKLGKAHLVKESGQLYVMPGKRPVVRDTLEEIWDHLRQLRMERTLSEKEIKALRREDFFTEPEERIELKFPSETIIFQLGEKIALSESFYMEKISNGRSTWMVVRDDGPHVGIYFDDSHNSPDKYYRLKNYFSLTENHLEDRRILLARRSDSYFERFWSEEEELRDIKNWKSVEVQLKNEESYSLIGMDMEGRFKTEPPPPKGIHYLGNGLTRLIQEIMKMEGASIPSPNIKDNAVLSNVIVNTKGNRNYTFVFFYHVPDSSAALGASPASSYAVHLTWRDEFFLLDNKLNLSEGEFFLKKVGDYWDKRMFTSFSQIPLSPQGFKIIFAQGKGHDLVLRQNKETLQFQAEWKSVPTKGLNIRHDSFIKLFQFLSGSGVEAQADGIISPIVAGEKANEKDHRGLRLEFSNFSLDLSLKEKNLIVTRRPENFTLLYVLRHGEGPGMDEPEYFSSKVGLSD